MKNETLVTVRHNEKKESTGFKIPCPPWLTPEEWEVRTDAKEARECRFVSE